MNYIFDFDGTLADSLPAMIVVYNKIIRHDQDQLTKEEIQALRNMGSRKALRSLGIHWWQYPRLLLQGMPEFKSLVPTLESFDGLPETLQQLQARGDRLFIVTSNTRGSVDEFLELHYFEKFFEDIVTGASLFKKGKHIRRLMKDLGLKRRETVYVGDETRDIQAARLSRIKVVSVTWGLNTAYALKKRRPNFMIDTPAELLDIKLGGK